MLGPTSGALTLTPRGRCFHLLRFTYNCLTLPLSLLATLAYPLLTFSYQLVPRASKPRHWRVCVWLSAVTIIVYLPLLAVDGDLAYGRRLLVRPFGIRLADFPVPVPPNEGLSIPRRVVHLDLKGMPPRPAFLINLMPLLKKWGATDILVEWEDMFPFTGEFEVVRSPNAYSPAAIKAILQAAAEAELGVIPLVQTLGKLDYILKHRQFAYLREVHGSAYTLCPSHPHALSVITKILEQILSLHPGVKRVHLGGAWEGTAHAFVPSCVKCKRGVGNEFKVNPDLAYPYSGPRLFLSHMLPLIATLEGKGMTPMMWDDHLRWWSFEDLEILAETKVELVVWNHSPLLEATPEVLHHYVWNKYKNLFHGRLWGGSAYKGADKQEVVVPSYPDTSDLSEAFQGLQRLREEEHSSSSFFAKFAGNPDATRFSQQAVKLSTLDQVNGDLVPLDLRLSNHLSWLRLQRAIAPIALSGFVLAGFARPSHTEQLSETIPAAIPSLALCLTVLREGHYSDQMRDEVLSDLGVQVYPVSPSLLTGVFVDPVYDELIPWPNLSLPVKTSHQEKKLLRARYLASAVLEFSKTEDAVNVAKSPNAKTVIPALPLTTTFHGGAVYELCTRLQHIRLLEWCEHSSFFSAIGTTLEDPLPEINAVIARSLRALVASAEEVLPSFFFPDDIEEFMTSKLGIVQFRHPSPTAPETRDTPLRDIDIHLSKSAAKRSFGDNSDTDNWRDDHSHRHEHDGLPYVGRVSALEHEFDHGFPDPAASAATITAVTASDTSAPTASGSLPLSPLSTVHHPGLGLLPSLGALLIVICM